MIQLFIVHLFLSSRRDIMVEIVATEPRGAGFDYHRKRYWYSSGEHPERKVLHCSNEAQWQKSAIEW